MKRIYLVTHCEATHSVEKKVGGWFDSSLTVNGEKRAALLTKKINELGFVFENAIVYSSDLLRAVQTAEIILRKSQVNLRLDSRLREMSFGEHEGIPQNEHNKIMIAESPIDQRLDHRICTGAESRREVAFRVSQFVEEVMQSDTDHLVITHGFAATFFIAAFQKIDIESQGYLNYKLSPGSITVLEEDDLFKNRSLVLLNG
jgi:probable phosphoglycerate mutase